MAYSDDVESTRARLAGGSSVATTAPADMYTAVSAGSLTTSGALPVGGSAKIRIPPLLRNVLATKTLRSEENR